jgi:hypothetical protein
MLSEYSSACILTAMAQSTATGHLHAWKAFSRCSRLGGVIMRHVKDYPATIQALRFDTSTPINAVYMIASLHHPAWYIGQTGNLTTRTRQHFLSSAKAIGKVGIASTQRVHRYMKYIGINEFFIIPLVLFPASAVESERLHVEKLYIRLLQPQLNVRGSNVRKPIHQQSTKCNKKSRPKPNKRRKLNTMRENECFFTAGNFKLNEVGDTTTFVTDTRIRDDVDTCHPVLRNNCAADVQKDNEEPVARSVSRDVFNLQGDFKDANENEEGERPHLFKCSDWSAVFQECRIFQQQNLVRMHPRKCCHLITKLLYLLAQGNLFSRSEATEVLVVVTSVHQSSPVHLRRMIYLFFKEVTEATASDEVINVTSCLIKDIHSNVYLYRGNAIRVLSKIIDGTMLAPVDQYTNQAIMDKNPRVTSTALVLGLHFVNEYPDLVRRWVNEAQQAVKSDIFQRR